MCQVRTLVLFFCSLSGFAQLYVSEGSTFSLETSKTILSSQASLSQIDTPILGDGVFVLNSTSTQILTSIKALLVLPALRLENADLVHLYMPLDVEYQLLINSRQFTLYHDLALTDPAAIVFGIYSSIQLTPSAQLVYKTEFKISTPLTFFSSVLFLKYIGYKWFQLYLKKSFIRTPTSNFEVIVLNDYDVNYEHYTPPPQVLLRAANFQLQI